MFLALPPAPFTAPTFIPSATGASNPLTNLETSYAPKAQAISEAASSLYFSHLSTLKAVSFLLSVFFIACTIYFLIKTGWLATRVDRVRDFILKSDMSKKRSEEAWDNVEAYFFAGSDNDLKMAVIEADKLLDEALLRAGIPGGDVGEKLKKIKTAQLPNVEAVWQAHKLRNKIAHESDFVLKRDLAERALTVYEKALENLGVLDKEDETTPTEPQNRSPR